MDETSMSEEGSAIDCAVAGHESQQLQGWVSSVDPQQFKGRKIKVHINIIRDR